MPQNVELLRRETDALKIFEKQENLIISDIMMPETDGFKFAETIRRQDENIPILFIMTARDDFSAKERGYHIGIDDYMVKPINMDELLLHIEALLCRANIAAEKKLTVGNLVLNEGEISAAVNGEPVVLTLREFQILFKLLSYPLDFMSSKLPGLGDVDWGKYVSALTDIGFDGYTCIEVEDKAFEGGEREGGRFSQTEPEIFKTVRDLRLQRKRQEQEAIETITPGA